MYDGKGNYFGASYDSYAYKTYSIYTSTAAYNASLGGYHYGSVSSGITNPGYYNAYGPFSVTESELKTKSKGSTAKYQPNTLSEKLALEEVRSNPQGKVLKDVKMNDNRWPSHAGWVKMQQIREISQGKLVIHYVYNTRLDLYDDFKIVGYTRK